MRSYKHNILSESEIAVKFKLSKCFFVYAFSCQTFVLMYTGLNTLTILNHTQQTSHLAHLNFYTQEEFCCCPEYETKRKRPIFSLHRGYPFHNAFKWSVLRLYLTCLCTVSSFSYSMDRQLNYPYHSYCSFPD